MLSTVTPFTNWVCSPLRIDDVHGTGMVLTPRTDGEPPANAGAGETVHAEAPFAMWPSAGAASKQAGIAEQQQAAAPCCASCMVACGSVTDQVDRLRQLAVGGGEASPQQVADRHTLNGLNVPQSCCPVIDDADLNFCSRQCQSNFIRHYFVFTQLNVADQEITLDATAANWCCWRDAWRSLVAATGAVKDGRYVFMALLLARLASLELVELCHQPRRVQEADRREELARRFGASLRRFIDGHDEGAVRPLPPGQRQAFYEGLTGAQRLLQSTCDAHQDDDEGAQDTPNDAIESAGNLRITAQDWFRLMCICDANVHTCATLHPLWIFVHSDPSAAESNLAPLRGLLDAVPAEKLHPHGVAFYEVGCRFNHSCVPNARFIPTPAPVRAWVQTTLPIAPGAEVKISYVKLSDDPDGSAACLDVPRRRREYLAANYGFDCDCARCTAPTPTP